MQQDIVGGSNSGASLWVAHRQNILTQGTQFPLFLLQVSQSIAVFSVAAWREIKGAVLRVRHTQRPERIQSRSNLQYSTQDIAITASTTSWNS